MNNTIPILASSASIPVLPTRLKLKQTQQKQEQELTKTPQTTKAKRVIRVIHKKLDASTTEK